MIYDERENRHTHFLRIAAQMMTAARTSPKGKGIDALEIMTVTDEDIERLADATRAVGEERGLGFFLRDAENIRHAEAVVLIGSRTKPQGLNCGYCGAGTCEAKLKNPEMPCALNTVDLGIALGSAVATAADLRADTRIMFSVGMAVKTLGLMTECHSVYAIPLSGSSKNPFFDRATKH